VRRFTLAHRSLFFIGVGVLIRSSDLMYRLLHQILKKLWDELFSKIRVGDIGI
jgi:hypothetical protein